MEIIQLNNIRKVFKKTIALDNLSLSVYKGDRLAVIGHNGSGKSTLLGIILKLLIPDDGDVSCKSQVIFSAILSKPLYIDYLSARDNIKISLLNNGIIDFDIEYWLSKYGLENLGNKKANKFSTGMKQRLSLSLCMLRNSDVYVFDEPINGFDQESKDLFLININDIIKKDKNIIIAAHDFSLLDKIANKILLLKSGKIVFYGTKEEVINIYGSIENLYNRENEDN